MSKVSIVGAYNTQFGSFVKKNKETGEVTDLKSIYDLMLEAGRGAIADASSQRYMGLNRSASGAISVAKAARCS
jgi:hypothetical protein